MPSPISNLLVRKSSDLEIFRFAADGLREKIGFQNYGTVASYAPVFPFCCCLFCFVFCFAFQSVASVSLEMGAKNKASNASHVDLCMLF